MSEWLPIATAPKDRPLIGRALYREDPAPTVFPMFWSEDQQYWMHSDVDEWWHVKPDAWQPFPGAE